MTRRQGILAVLEAVVRVGLGAMFVYSALAKIDDPGEFAYSVSRYKMLPEFTVGLFSLTMPAVELLTGLAMLFTRWMREASLLVFGMMVMFIIALSQALFRGLEISCGCFGVPSVGGRQEILMALVRDVVLIVPAAWLMFRQNGWLWPLGRLPRKWRIACQAAVGVFLALWALEPFMGGSDVSDGKDASSAMAVRTGSAGQGEGLVVSSGPIRPGEWNADFEGVLALAEREQRPMVLMCTGVGCQYCVRMEKSISGEAFRLWREDRKPLMAFVRDGSPRSPPEIVTKAIDFVLSINRQVEYFPYVSVYWPRGAVTNRVAFCGRRGQMGVKKNKLQVMEFMAALDGALGIRPAEDGHKTLQELLKAATIRVSVKADGGGKVSMTPKNGVLPEGKDGELVATPEPGHVFVEWRRPDGSRGGWLPRMTVNGSKPQGLYTARFRARSECRPPVLASAPATSICVRARNPFKYAIKVSDESRPVKFKLKSPLPMGAKLNSVSGVVSGQIMFPGTNTTTFAVIGLDPKHTELQFKLTFEVLPNNDLGPIVKADPDAGKDGEESKSTEADADAAKEDEP